MNNVLLYIGGFLVAVLAVLFAVPHFVDWNGYRGVFEEEATRMIGREVRVGGEVNVRFLPTPYVRFEKVRIADSEAATGESLFRVDSFKMWLAVPPLLKGVVEANEIELKRPVVRLASTADGTVNWSTLSLTPGNVPFVPAGVTLQDVRIINGVISLNGAQGTEIARIDGINGELAADALAGPYKFKGTAKWDGSLREVRLATANPEPNGDVRFKAGVTVDQTKNSYQLDGRISDLKVKPRIEGDLTSKIALGAIPGLTPARSSEAGGVPAEGAASDVGTVELRGKVSGDGTGFKIGDVAISIEHGGPPQIITGQATMSWLEKVKIEAGLQSQWLDFDRQGKDAPGRIPAVLIGSLFDALVAALPAEAETNVGMKFDQVNLGGDSLGAVAIEVERAGGPMRLKQFTARTPGGGALMLDGLLNPSPKEGESKFSGNLSLTSQSTTRFLAWAWKKPGVVEGRGDAPFTLTGRLQFTNQSIDLSGAKAEIGAMPLKGALRFDLGQPRKFTLSVEGQKIDVGQFLPGLVGLSSLSVLKPESGATEDALPANAILDFSRSDLDLRLKAETLVDGERELRNVDAGFSVKDNRLTISSLKFQTADGLEIDAEGEADDVRVTPKGTIRALIGAKSPEALRSFVRLLDLGADERAILERLSALAPMRMAGTVVVGARTAGSLELRGDGTAHGGRLTADVRLDGGREKWREAFADMLVSHSGTRSIDLFDALLNGGSVEAGEGDVAPYPRSVLFRATGTPANGLLSAISVKDELGSAEYDGRITLPGDGGRLAEGTVRVLGMDVRKLLKLADVTLAPSLNRLRVEGEAEVSLSKDKLTLGTRKLQVAESTVSGQAEIVPGANGGTSINAELNVDQAYLPRLLRPLLAAPVRPGESQDASAALSGGLWPEEAFDLAFLNQFSGIVKTRIKSLALQDGLTITDALVDLSFMPDRVEVTSLQGGAIGGKLESQMTFLKGAAGVDLKGRFQVAIGHAEASEEAGDKAADPKQSSFALEFEGRALSPAALMASLKGKGEITLGDVTLTGMGAGPVSVTAQAALGGTGPTGGPQLLDALKSALKQGQLQLGAIKIPVEIGDGALKLEKITVETDDGRSTFETAIELATLKIDSEWKVEARVKKEGEAASEVSPLMPPVSVVYIGSLAGLASIEPVIDASALERELIVRKMENDVEALERLRKFDQARAAQDLERQKQLEAERAKAAAAAAAAARAANPPPALAPDPAIAPDALAAPNVQQPGEIVPQGEAAPAGATTGAATVNGVPVTDPAALPVPPPPTPVRRVKPAYKKPAPAPGSIPLPF